MNRFLALTLCLLLAGCFSEKCEDSRTFSSWDFQQTWFITDEPGVENLGAGFGDRNGAFMKPIEIEDFSYCAKGNTLYISYGDFIKRKMEVEILSLDSETMTLAFPNGETVKYYRAGR